jgi:hypothetical protein
MLLKTLTCGKSQVFCRYLIKLSGDVFVCKRIGFAPFYDLIFDFGIVPTEWYFLFVILLDKILQNLEF